MQPVRTVSIIAIGDRPLQWPGQDQPTKHTASEGGIDAEFQVMSLASMNMT